MHLTWATIEQELGRRINDPFPWVWSHLPEIRWAYGINHGMSLDETESESVLYDTLFFFGLVKDWIHYCEPWNLKGAGVVTRAAHHLLTKHQKEQLCLLEKAVRGAKIVKIIHVDDPELN